MFLVYLTKRATRLPIKNMIVATGRQNRFWNLLTFSKKVPEPLKEHSRTYWVLYKLFEIQEKKIPFR